MKNNQKSFTSLILIGAIVVLIALGGYFVWSKKSEPITQKQTPEVTQTETSITTSKDETANWKTYTNSDYGFELKYPQDWKFVPIFERKPDFFRVEFFSPNTLKFDDILIMVQPILAVGNLEKYIKGSKEVLPDSIQEYFLDGVKGYKYLILGLNDYYTILVENRNRGYNIVVKNTSDENKLTKIKSQILSTFKFTK